MITVRRIGRGRFRACFAPFEAAGQDDAKSFGTVVAEKLITDHYARTTHGKAPDELWFDGPEGAPPLPGQLFAPNLRSMVAWLERKNGLNPAKFDAWRNQNLGNIKIPDILDSRPQPTWYEIKPASRTGIAAALVKFDRITTMMADLKLPYVPGSTYRGGTVPLDPAFSGTFANFAQRWARKLGGITSIQFTLRFGLPARDPVLGAALADAGLGPVRDGIILYWICVTITFEDGDAELEAVESLVSNISRWAVHLLLRSWGSGLNPEEPIAIFDTCNNATVREMFLPPRDQLAAAIFRSPPTIRYSVVGGQIAERLLNEHDKWKNFFDHIFDGPKRQENRLTLTEIAAIVLVVVAVGVIVYLTAPVSVPVIAGTAAVGAEATISVAVPATAMATGEAVPAAVLLCGTAVVDSAPVIASAGTTTFVSELTTLVPGAVRAVATSTAGRVALHSAAVLFVTGVATKARAATPPRPSSDPAASQTNQGGNTPAPTATAVEVVRLVPWSVGGPFGHTVAINPFGGEGAAGGTPRKWVGNELIGPYGLFLYDLNVADFPELHVVLQGYTPD